MYFSDLLKWDKIEEVNVEDFSRHLEKIERPIGHVAYVTGRDDDRPWKCLGEEPESVLNHSGGCED